MAKYAKSGEKKKGSSQFFNDCIERPKKEGLPPKHKVKAPEKP